LPNGFALARLPQASGVDLTQAAIEHTKSRLEVEGLAAHNYHLRQANAEHLPFQDDSFDIVYSQF